MNLSLKKINDNLQILDSDSFRYCYDGLSFLFPMERGEFCIRIPPRWLSQSIDDERNHHHDDTSYYQYRIPDGIAAGCDLARRNEAEDECKEKGIPVKCLKSFFRANGKAVTMAETDGFCKIVIAAEHKEGQESPYEPGLILGCHLYGPHASDIVQEACALITRKSTLKEFEDIIHTHPTLTEVLQSAVHN